MPRVAKPGAPVVYRLWPLAAGPFVFVAVMVGAVLATIASEFWTSFIWAASTLFVTSALANGMRVIAYRHPSARDFAFSDDVSDAEGIVRALEAAGLGFLAAEAWDNMSRASMGGHRGELASLQKTLWEAIRNARQRAPAAETIREFEAHVKALDAKLREDPK